MSNTYLKSAIEQRGTQSDPVVLETVRNVIADIRERGDDAVREYSEKFDRWTPESFKLSATQIDEIVARVPPEVINDIKTVQQNVRVFAQHQRDSLTDFEVELGLKSPETSPMAQTAKDLGPAAEKATEKQTN